MSTPDDSIYKRPITHHGGAKYLRLIHPADGNGTPIRVDVYAVLVAFEVTCPAVAHSLKKLLCAGQRGKGDRKADLQGAMDALWRALELIEAPEGAGVVYPANAPEIECDHVFVYLPGYLAYKCQKCGFVRSSPPPEYHDHVRGTGHPTHEWYDVQGSGGLLRICKLCNLAEGGAKSSEPCRYQG